MRQSDRESNSQFSQPVRQITLMLIAPALTGIGALSGAAERIAYFCGKSLF